MCTLFFSRFFFFSTQHYKKKKSHFHVISKYPFKRPLILHGAIERRNRIPSAGLFRSFWILSLNKFRWQNFVCSFSACFFEIGSPRSRITNAQVVHGIERSWFQEFGLEKEFMLLTQVQTDGTGQLYLPTLAPWSSAWLHVHTAIKLIVFFKRNHL